MTPFRWIALALLATLLCRGRIEATAAEYHFNPNSGAGNNWWMTSANWTPNGVPNSVDDVAVFDIPVAAGNSNAINVHSSYYRVQELRFNLATAWELMNARQDPTLEAPSGSALITQNGAGAVTFNTDLVFTSSTIFGGTGSGAITVNGTFSTVDTGDAYRETIRGSGGLTMDGHYTLTFNAPVSYQGPTVINAGTVLFNGDSKAPVLSGIQVVGYTPVTLQPVTVNGGTLGGSGNLRADVTVNAGATFSPGTTSVNSMTVKRLSLQTGSRTTVDLTGNGAGSYDQTIVTEQLGLGGTLKVNLAAGYTPSIGSAYTLFTYGTLDPAASQFDAVDLTSAPAIPALHPNWSWNLDYGTGTNSQVTLNYQSNPWYFTGGAYDPSYVSPDPVNEPANNVWWAIRANWNYNGKPGLDPANPDVVIFDDAHLNSRAPRETNIHDAAPGYLKELQVNTAAGWHFYNNNRTLAMKNTATGQPARITQNGGGPILMDVNLRLDSDTVFGGSGSGTVTVNGSLMDATGAGSFARLGVHGNGGLILDGHYTLVINNVANYQGTTTINAGGRLLFNAETAKMNPNWRYGEPATYYLPSTQGKVTVNAGGTLGGTGKLHAPVEVTAGGILAPGASAGVFTVDSLTLDPGSITRMELGGPTAGNGSGFHDQVIVAGLLSLGGTLDLSLLGGFQPTSNQSFVLFRYGSLDVAHNTFDTLVGPAGLLGTFALDYGTGANSQITLTAVPEPVALGLLLLGVVAVGVYRRK
jgi:autotransporter-associated beta strand protein